jgi:hypothetical protein
MTDRTHDSAFRRLKAALEEQDRTSERYDGAIGSSTELAAYARLCAAGEEVTARQAWLHWVDDEHYRGLNAGPFSLLAENSAPGVIPESTPVRGRVPDLPEPTEALVTVPPDRRGP